MDYIKSFKNKIIKLLIKVSYRFSDCIISISKELGKDLEKLCNKKVITIYNAAYDKKLITYNYFCKVSNTRLNKQKHSIKITKHVALCNKYFELQYKKLKHYKK